MNSDINFKEDGNQNKSKISGLLNFNSKEKLLIDST